MSVTAPGDDCRVDRLTVVCFFAGIEAGQRVSATITTATKQAGTLTASASVLPYRAADPAATRSGRLQRTCAHPPRRLAPDHDAVREWPAQLPTFS